VTAAKVSWTDVGFAAGVRLQAVGTGRTVVVVPGLEGDGTSCLHTVVPVWQELDRLRPTRLVLVNYATERHASLTALEDTVTRLVSTTAPQPFAVWGQSFGCLIAATLARRMNAERLVLVSPFTQLPRSRRLAASLLRFVPRALYRLSCDPSSRWVFGPMEGPVSEAFLASLRSASPRDVARRAAWVRDDATRSRMRAAVGPTTGVWFGSRDRLVDLTGQLTVFTELTRPGDGLPRLVPGSGHVVFPEASVRFLTSRALDSLTNGQATGTGI
jgi:pimeloyl-ACP methyl ester carboxylesterase